MCTLVVGHVAGALARCMHFVTTMVEFTVSAEVAIRQTLALKAQSSSSSGLLAICARSAAYGRVGHAANAVIEAEVFAYVLFAAHPCVSAGSDMSTNWWSGRPSTRRRRSIDRRRHLGPGGTWLTDIGRR